MSAELLPCPFCGVKAEIMSAPHGPRIYCRHDSTCLIRANIVYDFQIHEWNRRTPPPAKPEIKKDGDGDAIDCDICQRKFPRIHLTPDEGDEWWCRECMQKWEGENHARWEDGSPLT